MKQIVPFSEWEFSSGNEPFRTVTLPHQAFLETPVVRQPCLGGVVYRKRFAVPGEWKGKTLYLSIGAAMQKTAVFVNDAYLFTHFGGYQRFIVPLTDRLRYGEENVVRLEVDNAPSDDMPPGKPIDELDFCYHSGLYRDARLLVTDRLHITDALEVGIPAGGGVFIRTLSVDGGTARVAATCHVVSDIPTSERFSFLRKEDPGGPVSTALEIFGPDGALLARAEAAPAKMMLNGDHTFAFEVDIPQAPLWSCDSPALCKAVFTVSQGGREVDRREERFGIRTIRATPDGFYLNGVKTTLLGTNRHMEFPIVGNAAPPNAQRRDAILIKRAGFNFVRLSHYNQDPAFIDACDELGIAVMPAIPGWQHYATNSSFVNNVYRDCRELVRTLRNHPSVVFWEVSLNESYPPTWLNAEMHRIAHEEYPGDQCYTAGDSIGNFEGWDVLFFHDRLKRSDKPVLLREYGDWGFGGNESTSRRNRGDGAAALLGQAWNFQWSLNLALNRRGVIGSNDWCFIDYNRGYHTTLEESGSVDLFRVPKPKFHFYRSQGAKEPVLFAVRNGSKVVVFSNCDRVELRQGGRTVAAKGPDDGPDSPYNPVKATSPDWETAMLWHADSSGGAPYDGGNCRHLPHPPFTFFDVPEGDLEVVGLKDGKAAASQPLVAPGEVAFAETVVRDEGVPPVAGDLVFVDAVLRDEAGTLVPTERKVRFSAEGCEIIGVSGDATVAGIASCLVKAGEGGRIEIRAALV